MPQTLKPEVRLPATLAAIIALQAACALFFLSDIWADVAELMAGTEEALHLAMEGLATLGLVAAIAFETRFLRQLLERNARLAVSLEAASSAVHDVIEAHFDRWGLTPAERDVAAFLVKGLSITEIAELRGSAEGTVKAQLNAIYRKSETGNRGELLSVLIDSLMGQRSGEAAA